MSKVTKEDLRHQDREQCRPSSKKLPAPSDATQRSLQRGLTEIDSLFAGKRNISSSGNRTGKTTREKAPTNRKRKLPGTSKEMSVVEEHFSRASSEWADDGLGGQFNAEGFTGRKQDGIKIFKAHVLNRPNFGSSRDCPFDCDCCYI